MTDIRQPSGFSRPADWPDAAISLQWAAMHPPPRLRLEPRPSRIACAFIALAHVTITVLIGLLPLPLWLSGMGAMMIGAVAVRGFRQCTGRGVPALLHVGADRRITVSGRDGRSREGSIRDDTYVGAHLTVIVWRPDGTFWWAPSRSILILPDTLPADDFRRLRVVLRYGRPAAEARTSGVDAA